MHFEMRCIRYISRW